MNIKAIVNKFSCYAPQYGGGLTNHLPMAQMALYKLGCGEERLLEFSSIYIESKKIKKSIKHYYSINSIRDQLGNEQAYENYVDYYKDQIHKYGQETTVKSVVNELSSGLDSGLFHGIIRLSYALEVDNEAELARALAYYTSLYKESDFLGSRLNSKDLKAELLKIIVTHNQAPFYLHGNVEEKQRLLLDALMDLYFMSGSFIVLHGITGFHALMNLKDYYDDFSDVLDTYTMCVQRLLLRVSLDDFKEVELTSQDKSWQALLAVVCGLTDPHTIKFAFSCFKLHEIYKNDKLLDLIKMKLQMDPN